MIKLFGLIMVLLLTNACKKSEIPLMSVYDEKTLENDEDLLLSKTSVMAKEDDNENSFSYRFNNDTEDFRQKVDKEWGLKYSVTNQNKIVKYMDNYKSRIIVDYEKKQLRIDVKNKEDLEKEINNAFLMNLSIKTTDVFSGDFSKGAGPYLLDGLIKKPEITPSSVFMNNSGKSYYRIEINFIENVDVNAILHGKADKLITIYAKKSRISKEFLFAMAKMLSTYNSFYYDDLSYKFGLFALGENEIITENDEEKVSYTDLMDLEGNIIFATRYFNDLKNGQFKRIFDNEVLEMSMVLAYFMGADNYLKLFAKNKQQAVSIINSINSDRFYNELVKRLPLPAKEFLDNYRNNK